VLLARFDIALASHSVIAGFGLGEGGRREREGGGREGGGREGGGSCSDNHFDKMKPPMGSVQVTKFPIGSMQVTDLHITESRLTSRSIITTLVRLYAVYTACYATSADCLLQFCTYISMLAAPQPIAS
jgi:hypothetical protein